MPPQIPLQQPTQQQVAPEAQMEALRRRAQLGSSTATLGAPTANSPSPQNPLAQQGLTPTPQPAGGAAGVPPGAGGAPTDAAQTALGQQKGEAERITSALVARQKVLGEQGK